MAFENTSKRRDKQEKRLNLPFARALRAQLFFFSFISFQKPRTVSQKIDCRFLSGVHFLKNRPFWAFLDFTSFAGNGRGLLLEHGSGIARGGGRAFRWFRFWAAAARGRGKYRIYFFLFRCGCATVRVDVFQAEFERGFSSGVGFQVGTPLPRRSLQRTLTSHACCKKCGYMFFCSLNSSTSSGLPPCPSEASASWGAVCRGPPRRDPC